MLSNNQNVNSCLGCLSGVHKGPVTDIAWKSSLCVSGGRDGTLALWDINNEKSILYLYNKVIYNILSKNEVF